ncbi:MAG: hypothetical protein LBJ64_10635 [Deltaproteobacteria bacterium]|jgi:hypothetical protein|nr:hypothetical protein [Deltaproteobacteria bacterium]
MFMAIARGTMVGEGKSLMRRASFPCSGSAPITEVYGRNMREQSGSEKVSYAGSDLAGFRRGKFDRLLSAKVFFNIIRWKKQQKHFTVVEALNRRI